MNQNQKYPWRCAKCRQKAIKPATIEYRTQMKHENVLHDVVVPDLHVDKCENCGVVLISEDADQRVRDALRAQLQLLKPDQIRQNRDLLEMNQKQLADACGFASETICRWEKGVLQSRSSDRFLRAYFGLPDLRVFLAQLSYEPSLGERVEWYTSQTAAHLDWSAGTLVSSRRRLHAHQLAFHFALDPIAEFDITEKVVPVQTSGSAKPESAAERPYALAA